MRISQIPYLELVRNFVLEQTEGESSPGALARRDGPHRSARNLLEAELEELIDSSKNLRRYPPDDRLWIRDRAVKTMLGKGKRNRPGGYLAARLEKFGESFTLARAIHWPIHNAGVALQRWNFRHVTMTVLDPETGEERQMELPDPSARVADWAAAAHLKPFESCLGSLPERDRQMVLMYWVGHSWAEVAVRLGDNKANTVSQRYSRLLKGPFGECIERCWEAVPDGLLGGKRP